jgi:hypothetical protein
MTVYRILQKDSEVQHIPVGFSWLAFFFGPLWAFFKRSGFTFAVMLGVTVALFLLDKLVVRDSRSIVLALMQLSLYLGAAYVFGRYANAWVARSFLHGGFQDRGYTRLTAARPPRELEGAQVVLYAPLPITELSGAQARLQQAVLVICHHSGDDNWYCFECDGKWRPLKSAPYTSEIAAKQDAERSFEGLLWQRAV